MKSVFFLPLNDIAVISPKLAVIIPVKMTTFDLSFFSPFGVIYEIIFPLFKYFPLSSLTESVNFLFTSSPPKTILSLIGIYGKLPSIYWEGANKLDSSC